MGASNNCLTTAKFSLPCAARLHVLQILSIIVLDVSMLSMYAAARSIHMELATMDGNRMMLDVARDGIARCSTWQASGTQSPCFPSVHKAPCWREAARIMYDIYPS